MQITEELLEKVLKLALRDDDDDVRAASLKLASTFLQDVYTMGAVHLIQCDMTRADPRLAFPQRPLLGESKIRSCLTRLKTSYPSSLIPTSPIVGYP